MSPFPPFPAASAVPAVTLADVEAAARLIAHAVPHTPLLPSRTLSRLTGAEVFIKFENHQFTASFKERGALNRLSALSETERARGVIAMSAGNHAQGVAYHAQRLGIPAVIVMPADTPFVKVKHTRDFGARVVLEGETVAESRLVAERIREEEGLTFVHPYNDPWVIAGQGTVALEMLADQPDLDILVAPIGGGGLLGGMAVAAKAVKPAIEMIGVQVGLYPSAYNALHGLPPCTGGATVAEGIAVKEPGDLTLPLLRALVSRIILVDETAVEEAISLYLSVEKTVAEGAGAASLAALLTEPQRFRGKKVGLVLSGGNIDPRIMASVIMRSLVREGRIAHLSIRIGDKPGQLARVATVIGETGGNIVEVRHERLTSDISVKSTDLRVILETRDHTHLAEILERLAAAGFPANERSFSGPAAGD
ncbi:threonine dehydratase [Rhodospirillum rubrum F11]|uniref:L-threonine ammonia-lyase n=2 Tax=Rhodospirillum rubrum TaxID=1085 RepID=Q2RQC1_RHORT|nr:threonine ammonia-lyase [Rhodospirillum rubrum]ABC23674.1 L-threonine ammonia-lyase [Rhodospirillum rubrum ATCC 11170]AEO49412.1 threonine dehydratase [Rhodospirillum rubrum F11]QXG79634.1 threonine ammonia-lyase [Rhodospirillum rubrum]